MTRASTRATSSRCKSTEVALSRTSALAVMVLRSLSGTCRTAPALSVRVDPLSTPTSNALPAWVTRLMSLRALTGPATACAMARLPVPSKEIEPLAVLRLLMATSPKLIRAMRPDTVLSALSWLACTRKAPWCSASPLMWLRADRLTICARSGEPRWLSRVTADGATVAWALKRLPPAALKVMDAPTACASIQLCERLISPWPAPAVRLMLPVLATRRVDNHVVRLPMPLLPVPPEVWPAARLKSPTAKMSPAALRSPPAIKRTSSVARIRPCKLMVPTTVAVMSELAPGKAVAVAARPLCA